MSHYATQPSSAESRNLNEDENRELNTDFNNMMTYAEIIDEIAHEEARDIASRLLMHPNLPLLLRADAHIILACGKMDYLYHAQEAVCNAELGQELLGSGKTSEGREDVEDRLNRAREALRRAECDSAELKRIKEGLKAGTIDDSEAEKNIDSEAKLDETKSISNSADDTEALQSKVEESIHTKSKGKRKSCSASDDSGEEENVVDDKKHSSSKGRKASKLTITP